MSLSLYKITNNFGTDVIYNYFDLSGSISIKTSYNESNNDGTKLKSNSALFISLKHINNIGYKIPSGDIASLYVPKCYVYSGVQTTTISVPITTNRIVFLLQAPGGDGANGSTSPDNNGGDGGSGALYMGYISRNSNNVTSILLTMTDTPAQLTPSVASTLAFTGGTSLTLTCYSGTPGQGTNSGGAGGVTPTTNVSVGLTTLYSYAGTNGTNSSRINTISPYGNQPDSGASDTFLLLATTKYYPLLAATYGYGGVGGNYGGAGSGGSWGICAIWFLI